MNKTRVWPYFTTIRLTETETANGRQFGYVADYIVHGVNEDGQPANLDTRQQEQLKEAADNYAEEHMEALKQRGRIDLEVAEVCCGCSNYQPQIMVRTRYYRETKCTWES